MSEDVYLKTTVDVGQAIVAQLVSGGIPHGYRKALEVHLLDQDVVDGLFGLGSPKEYDVTLAVFGLRDRHKVILYDADDPLPSVFGQRVTLDLDVVSNQQGRTTTCDLTCDTSGCY